MKLPQAFEEKMKGLLGEDFDSYIACFDNPRYYGLRVNTQKISVEEFQRICPFEIRPIPWIHNGFYYDGEKEVPSRHPYYFAGLYYLQEPSAMTPADRLPEITRPFYRLDPSRSGEGFGLGLALVERISRLHGARLVIESEPGRGTRVSLAFESLQFHDDFARPIP